MRKQTAETENKPLVTLEQWRRRADGEDITAEIPAHRRAEFAEWERVVAERQKQAEEVYLMFNPDMQKAM